MQIQNDEITQGDILSINALVELLVAEKGFHRENSYFLIEQEFKVPNINHLKRADIDRAIALLVDLQDISVH